MKVEVGELYLNWFNSLILKEAFIYDDEHNEMIALERLTVKFSLLDFILIQKLTLRQAVLEEAKINLIESENGLNLLRFIDSLSSGDQNDKGKTTFSLESILLKNTKFFYQSLGASEMPRGNFNQQLIRLDSIYAEFFRFNLYSDTLDVNVAKFSALETNSGLKIEELKSNFQLSKKAMHFDRLFLKTQNSTIRDQIRFNYSEYEDLGNFFEKVNLDCHFANSVIDSKDLVPFSSSVLNYPFKVEVSGSFTGKANEMISTDFSLCLGSQTYLNGAVELRNLPDIENTIFIFDFEKSKIFSNDILNFLPQSSHKYVSKFGTINFSADFYGAISDFVTDGVFQTDLGAIQTNFELKSNYEGEIILTDFNLGSLLDINSLGKINLNAEIIGSGLDLLQNDSIIANADITSLQLLGYDYQNTFASFRFGRKIFDGTVTMADTNMRFNFDGRVSLADSTFDFTAKFDTIRLAALNQSNLPIMLSFEIDADFKGLEPDNVDGYIKIINLNSYYENRRFKLNEFFVSITDLEGIKKRFVINSDLLRAKIEGDYSFTGFASDLSKLFQNYPNFIFKAPQDLSFSYKPYKYYYSLKLTDPNRFTRFINYPLYISSRTEIRGNFEVDSTVRFSLNLKSDSIFYLSNKLYTPDLWLSLEYDSSRMSDPYHFELLFSPRLLKFSSLEFNKFRTTVFNVENLLFFAGEIENKISNDKININGTVEIDRDSVVVSLGRDTQFSLLDNFWESKGKNKIIYDWGESDIIFEQVSFGTQGQLLGVDGVISRREEEIVTLLVKDFDIDALSPYIGTRLTGLANIRASLQDPYDSSKFTFEATANQIKLKNFLVGDLTAQSSWDAENSRLITQVDLMQNDEELLKVRGYLNFLNQEDFFHLDIFMENTPLLMLEPFVSQYLTIQSGGTLGAISIRGSTQIPKIKGDIFVSETKFKINYSNVTYFVNDRITFDENKIKFKNFRSRDDLGNICRIDGLIEHSYFNKLKLALKATLQDFKVLATKQTPYSLFYGTVFMSGTASINGDVEHPDLIMDLTTERGTRIYMPLETSITVEEQQDFVRFVKDSVEAAIRKEVIDKVSVSGFEMSLNLEIGSETYAEIMINKKTGDLIEVYGKGKLSITTNSNDELMVFGRVEVETGKYRLSFINLISKEFEIRQPSSLSWSGDPLKADLNITAVYRQNIPLIPILEGADSSIIKTPEVRRRYPVETVLLLKGDMFQPTVSYDIVIMDYPAVVLAGGIPFSIDAQVSAFKQSIKNNEQELNRQVFSLIMLKTFSARNTFSGGNFAGGSVGELLANQLSYWVSQVDNNLEVDVDLQGLTREALNSARIRLSYTALGGRVRITREGSVGQSAATQSNVSSVLGDWVVEYMIKNDGSLRLKMYHRQNLSAFTNTIGGIGTTTGVSIMHTKSFDLGRRRKKLKRKN